MAAIQIKKKEIITFSSENDVKNVKIRVIIIFIYLFLNPFYQYQDIKLVFIIREMWLKILLKYIPENFLK